MNHHALLLKLMDRTLPNQLLTIFELWFSISVTGVKWNGHASVFSERELTCSLYVIVRPSVVCRL